MGCFKNYEWIEINMALEMLAVDAVNNGAPITKAITKYHVNMAQLENRLKTSPKYGTANLLQKISDLEMQNAQLRAIISKL